jgi:aryl-alcohol dehydrogenase-like predicted oxidoreductase
LQYTVLGRSGLIVSRLAFGAGSLGVGETLPGLRKNLDQAAACRIIAKAIDAGVNLFDSSDAYTSGQSETLLGAALEGRRAEIVISTKCGLRVGKAPTDAGLSRRHIIEAAEASLKRLRTDWIDVYHLHTIDPLTPIEEIARACEALVRDGKVRCLALSNWPAWMAAQMLEIQKHEGGSPIVAMQLYYSLVGRDIEEEHVPFAQANDLGLLIWSPLAGGFLTGKYTRETPNPAGARRSTFEQPPVELEKGYGVVDVLRALAVERECEPASIAMAWLLAKPAVSSVIFGISREDQLERNLAQADLILSEDEVARLDAVSASPVRFPNWMLAMTPDPITRNLLGRNRA